MLHERYHPIIVGLRELPKPVLAAVNGPAVAVPAHPNSAGAASQFRSTLAAVRG